MRPRLLPKSQCALGSKLNCGFSPQLRTTWLADSSGPTGVSAEGMLGSLTSRDTSSFSAAPSLFLFFIAARTMSGFSRINCKSSILLFRKRKPYSEQDQGYAHYL